MSEHDEHTTLLTTQNEWFADPLWYKDAVIYELHVKAYFDTDGNGIGDFCGLTEKLDYLQDLGVNTLWLLPFYPSPLRDDGYDIADYRNVHPDYGTRADVQHFIREAHRRNLKIITELVINHTSDQHPWFQAARRSRPGSRKRDFYVWSDTDKKFPETRIIFTDTEKSNWAWDDVANAYYWHRFFSHQPDLNFDNPAVVRTVIRIMRFWLDMGVDGLRLDAIPYLCVQDGTNNENLPQTHTVIKQLREVIDAHYSDRMLLAEANQWPEDVREYFGEGDECHMAYHFPLMPRVFMAVAQEDRHPILEIMRQTPEIPANCQWALFLRNHDELTLEMVTSKERDYMYRMYANDPRMRINVGIRRRLAPLMDNNRDKIELAKFLLLTMPGSPIIYYGDEIGMGDNIYLGDRNGVRTPMQWSPDRNGGFSRADPQRLYLPPVMDPVYGYEAVNVETQRRNPSSLLHWTRRMIAVRNRYRAFGRGTIRFIEPGNRKILAYVREWEDEIVLCVVNLSRTAQPAELDLTCWKGRVPVELIGRTPFPPITALPYHLSLKGYGYYGFRIATDVEHPFWHTDVLPDRELPVLVLTEGWTTFAGGRADASVVRRAIANTARARLKSDVIEPYLATRSWFSGRGKPISDIRIPLQFEWNTPTGNWLLAFIEVHVADGKVQRYFLPLSILWEDQGSDAQHKALMPWTLVRVRQKSRMGVLYGAFGDERFCRALAANIAAGFTLNSGAHRVEFTPGADTTPFSAAVDAEIRHPALEQSNTSVYFGQQLFLKGYRRLSDGISPEVEMGQHLSGTLSVDSIAPYAGTVTLHEAGMPPTTLVVLQRYVDHQCSAWHFATNYLTLHLAERLGTHPEPQSIGSSDEHASYCAHLEAVGTLLARLHCALATPSDDPAFAPGAITSDDIAAWADEVREDADEALHALESIRDRLPPPLHAACDHLLALRPRILDRVALQHINPITALKTRCHGAFDLAQILMSNDRLVVTDFEGDPEVPIARRRARLSPLSDAATLIGSLSQVAAEAAEGATVERPDDRRSLGPLARAWEVAATNAFLAAYREALGETGVWPNVEDQGLRLIDFFLIKAGLRRLSKSVAQQKDACGSALFDLLRLLEQSPLSNS